MKRRDFIKKTALMAGAAGWANNALADETKVVQSTIMNEGQQIHAIDDFCSNVTKLCRDIDGGGLCCE